jgi:hypothetical protein
MESMNWMGVMSIRLGVSEFSALRWWVVRVVVALAPSPIKRTYRDSAAAAMNSPMLRLGACGASA